MRRHHQHVDTFPFLAVLLCAMGSLILVLLVMDRRSKLVAQARANEQARRQVQDHARAHARLKADTEVKKKAQKVDWEKKRDALRARVDAEEKGLSEQLRQVQRQLAEAAARARQEVAIVRKLRQQLEEEKSRLAKQEQILAGTRKEAEEIVGKVAKADRSRAKLAGELVQLEKLIRELQTTRERDEQTYSVIPYHGKRGDNRSPIYIECAANGLVFHPDRFQLDSSAEEAIRTEIARRKAAQKDPPGSEARPYLMVLVRPDGIRRFYDLQAAIRGLSVDFGYELVNADWQFRFPDRHAKPSPAPAPAPAPASTPAPPVRLVNPEPVASGVGLTRPVPFGRELPSAPQAGSVVSSHRPTSRPAETGIETPSLLPGAGGSPKGTATPPKTGIRGEQGPRGGPAPLRPAQITGPRDWTVFVECKGEMIIVHPTQTQISIEHLNHNPAHNRFYQFVRQTIAKRHARVQPGDKPTRVQVRFLIHRDGERVFHRAYPLLETLPVDTSRYNLLPDEDVNRIIAGY
jgi:hypothetical protein